MTFLSKLIGFSTGFLLPDVLLAIFFGIIFILCLTNAVTTAQFRWTSNKRSKGLKTEPPTLPYWLPYIGHMFQMADLHSLYEDAARQSPQRSPVSIRLSSVKMYLVFGQENVAALFRNSKYLEKENLTKQAFKNSGSRSSSTVSGMTSAGTQRTIAEIDDAEAARIGRKLHDLQHLLLSQPADIKAITDKFTTFFRQEIYSATKDPGRYGLKAGSEDKMILTGLLFRLIKRIMFRASTAALMGTKILELNDDLTETYWDYDKAFLLGEPELLEPPGSGARDKLLTAIRKYIESGSNAYDWNRSDDPAWEEQLGCRLFRTSLKEMRDRGIATSDQANAILSLVWATASNSVPTTTWMLMAVAGDEKLAAALKIDLTQTGSGDLIQSMYLETLRLRASVTVTRKLTADIEIDGYTLKQGHYVMTPSYLPHTRPRLWNGKDEKGREWLAMQSGTFWPHRFVKLGGSAATAGEKVAIEAERNGNKDEDETNKSENLRLQTALRPENFFPYGGGNAVCPGRFFSRQKILGAVRVFLSEIDFIGIEGTIDPDGSTVRPVDANGLQPDTRYAGGGAMPPDGDLLVKMRFRGSLKDQD